MTDPRTMSDAELVDAWDTRPSLLVVKEAMRRLRRYAEGRLPEEPTGNPPLFKSITDDKEATELTEAVEEAINQWVKDNYPDPSQPDWPKGGVIPTNPFGPRIEPCRCAARLDTLEPKLTSDLAFLRGQVEEIFKWITKANDYHAKIDRLEWAMRSHANEGLFAHRCPGEVLLADKIAVALGNQEGSR